MENSPFCIEIWWKEVRHMSIEIDKKKCVKCKKCFSVCPGSLIGPNKDGKASIKYPKDCWGCCSCVKECKVNAISLYLGADIGGRGSQMTVEQKVEKVDHTQMMHWEITESDKTVHAIDINPKASNQY